MSEEKEKTPGQIILGWWSSELVNPDNPASRGLSARLRRASPVTALAEEAVHKLAAKLEEVSKRTSSPRHSAERISILVRLLAEVREHGPSGQPAPLAELMGARAGGEDARRQFSELRFQKLMRAEDEELCSALRRAIRQMKGRCNVATLGQDILRWDDKTRMAWCFNYFGQNAPQTEKTESE